ncbi:MAG TPA: pre-peptidase C-terminal domain-containing protein, partial [Thermoanaerobaculia bacterium]|nr:pre-peptidase C-terminal domain-containing protein [Thermoanaerobaculia bacterium]
SFDVTQGQTLVVETSGLTGGLDTLVGVYLPDGTFLDRDDDGGGGLASRFVFTATESGRYTAYVSSFGFTSGTYLFSVSSSP